MLEFIAMDTREIESTQDLAKSPFMDRIHERWSAFQASPVRVFLLALACAFFFCTITELTWVKADLNDDYTIASVLSGRLMGDDQGLCLFLNAIMCNIIYALNMAFPHFNWFAVLELVTVFVSYTVICYLSIRYLRIEMAFLIVAVVAYFSLPGCFTIDNFTFVSFICSCAGCMLLCRSLSYERHNLLDLVGGIVLLSIGSLWRNIMAWLCVPIFGIAAIAIVVRMHPSGTSVAKTIARLWPFFLAVIIGFGMTVYDLTVWKASPWDEWRSYNDTRSMLSDFPHHKYEDIQEELQELGVSKNDYELLFTWTTEDPDFFTTEKLEQITDVAIIDWSEDKTPFSIAKTYAKTVLGSFELIVLVIAVAIAGLLFMRGRGRAWAIGVIAMALIMALFFSAMGRLPQRVHYPIWMYTLCAIGMLQIVYRWSSGRSQVKSGAKHAYIGAYGQAKMALITAGCLAVACAPLYAGALLSVKCADNFAPQRLAVTFNADDQSITGPLTDYIHDHPDNAYVLHNAGHRQLRLEHYLKAYYDDPLQFHVVSLGGWLSRSPYNNTKNASLDLANPLKGLVDNADAQLIVSNKSHAEKIERYLQEHYYPDAKGEVVDTLGKKQGMHTKLYVYEFSKG